MRRLLALLTVLALLFAACGDDGDSGSSDDKGDPSSEAEDADNDPELEAKLLTADELGGKWTKDADSADSDNDDEEPGPECLKDPPNDPDHEKAEASFTFDKDVTGFPSLQEQVTDYHDEATITSAFDTAAAALDSCGEFSFEDGEYEYTGSIEPLDFPTVGDASEAWTLRLSAEGFDFTAFILYARTGQFGMSLYYLSDAQPDLEEFGQLADQAIAKV
jgi:hypothetical protein